VLFKPLYHVEVIAKRLLTKAEVFYLEVSARVDNDRRALDKSSLSDGVPRPAPLVLGSARSSDQDVTGLEDVHVAIEVRPREVNKSTPRDTERATLVVLRRVDLNLEVVLGRKLVSLLIRASVVAVVKRFRTLQDERKLGHLVDIHA